MATNVELIEATVSAALDGEIVDVEELRRALDTVEGRDALAAFVLLRAATADERGASASGEITRDVMRRLETVERPRLRLLAGYRVPAAVAACVAGLAVAASFWLGTAWQPSHVAIELTRPTAPAIRETVAPAPFPGVIEVMAPPLPCPPSSAAQPPMPKRVLRYVRGVDWRDGT